MTAEDQRGNVRIAAEALAPIARQHELVISHGNGPQVGLLALQGAAYKPDEAYPLDVLGAETEGMIGYMIEQELGNLLPFERAVRDAADDGRGRSRTIPGSRTRPSSSARSTRRRDAERLAAEKGWVVKPDGDKWRRVVPSPEPKRIFEIAADQVAARERDRGHRGRRRRHPDDVRDRAPSASWSASRRHRQGSVLGAAGARARGRPVRHADRRRRGLSGLGQADAESDPPEFARSAQGHCLCRRLDGPEGRGGLPVRREERKARSDRRAGGPEAIIAGKAGTTIHPEGGTEYGP